MRRANGRVYAELDPTVYRVLDLGTPYAGTGAARLARVDDELAVLVTVADAHVLGAPKRCAGPAPPAHQPPDLGRMV